jgi:hypothetical protein
MDRRRDGPRRRLRRGSAGPLALLGSLALAACISAPALADHGPPQLVSYGADGQAVGGQSINMGQVSEDGRHIFLVTKARLTTEDTDSFYDVYERTGNATTLVSTGPNSGTGPGPFSAGEPTISADGSHVFFYTNEPLVSADTDDASDIYERFDGVTSLVSTGPSGENAEDPRLAAISKDGSHAFFTTGSNLVPEDHDGQCAHDDYEGGYYYLPCVDIYERSGGTTKFVSIGGSLVGGANIDAEFIGASDDGTHVFFKTPGDLVPGVYDRTGGETLLVTRSESGGTDFGVKVPFFYSRYKPFSADGSRFLFITGARLVDEDTDSSEDLYMISNGVVTFISHPTTGNDEPGPGYIGSVSTNGGTTPDFHHIFFNTAAALVAEDTGGLDVYEWSDGDIRLVTPDNDEPAGFQGASDDGSHVFFTTRAALTPDDKDGHCEDLYERAGDITRLVSTGPTAQLESPFGYCETIYLQFIGSSRDGSRVFFSTYEPLVERADNNYRFDIYERFNGETSLISEGGPPFGWNNDHAELRDDGRRVYFNTYDPLVASDTNTEFDLYVATANRPPDCSGVRPDRAVLWPANKGLRLVGLSGASDPDGDAVTLAVAGVSQDEPLAGQGAATTPDARKAPDPSRVYLRAKREPKGDGRVYRLDFNVTDELGGACSGTVRVTVPRHAGSAAVDSAPSGYDSFGG